MEDEVKIFIAGAKKIAKLKGYTQTDIANGIEWPLDLNGSQGTISSYFVGRTRPRLEVVLSIANFLAVPYEEILQTGREALQPESPRLAAKVEKLEKAIEDIQSQGIKTDPHPPNDIETKRLKKLKEHYSVVEEYQDQETAILINQKLIEIEKLDPEIFKDINAELQTKIDNLKRRLPKSVSGEANTK